MFETSSLDMGVILIEVDGSKSDPIPPQTEEERARRKKQQEDYLSRLRGPRRSDPEADSTHG